MHLIAEAARERLHRPNPRALLEAIWRTTLRKRMSRAVALGRHSHLVATELMGVGTYRVWHL
jgi:hypothetical protein